jgi:hypothetical protein
MTFHAQVDRRRPEIQLATALVSVRKSHVHLHSFCDETVECEYLMVCAKPPPSSKYTSVDAGHANNESSASFTTLLCGRALMEMSASSSRKKASHTHEFSAFSTEAKLIFGQEYFSLHANLFQLSFHSCCAWPCSSGSITLGLATAGTQF